MMHPSTRIYTSHFAQCKNLPAGIVPISIARKTPPWFKHGICLDLAPSYELLFLYKDGQIDTQEYTRRYWEEVLASRNPAEFYTTWRDQYPGKDIALCCWEGLDSFCHRQLVADWFNQWNPSPFPVQEFDFEAFRQECKRTCFFTGHRPGDLGGWEHNPTWQQVKLFLRWQIRQKIREGCTRFISGMALGVDLWAADIVTDLRRQHPEISLVAAVPFQHQMSPKWRPADQQLYQQLLSEADEVYTICDDPYAPWKMHVRNHWMVDHSNAGIAVLRSDKDYGGTWECAKYAHHTLVPLVLYDPVEDQVRSMDADHISARVIPLEDAIRETASGINSD